MKSTRPVDKLRIKQILNNAKEIKEVYEDTVEAANKIKFGVKAGYYSEQRSKELFKEMEDILHPDLYPCIENIFYGNKKVKNGWGGARPNSGPPKGTKYKKREE